MTQLYYRFALVPVLLVLKKIRVKWIYIVTRVTVLKINGSKCARGLDPWHGNACSAKSFEVLALIFSTDCSPIDWLQSVLKIRSFENIFLFFLLFENQASRLGAGKLD